jgi:glycerol-3-phosphate O-acyltransferase
MKGDMNEALPGQELHPYGIDYKPGFFLSWLFYKLLKKVRVDEGMREKLKQLQKQGTVVYAIKYRSQLDYLMYHYYFRTRRFPSPRLAFDLNLSLFLPVTRSLKVYWSRLSFLLRTGYVPDPYESGVYKSAILEGTPSLLFLVDEKGFMQHFIHFGKDRLEYLLETQREMKRPVFVVPLLTLYNQKPEKESPSFRDVLFGFSDRPGTIGKTILFFRHHRQPLIDFGEPLNLKEYLESHSGDRPLNQIAADLRNRLIDGIDNQRRVVLGPVMKSRQEFKETVLTDPALTRKMESKSGGSKKNLKRLRKQAGAYFDEIAADYNIAYVHGVISIFRWFMKKVFEGIVVDHAGIARAREWARKGPVIYVPSHKSHIDYLVLNYVLHEHHTHVPRIAAGRNLAFWPMGYIFRKCGAFFIRRSFRQDTLYVEVFNRYIKALLENGHPIEFFIEGGRSRNGKLVSPKKGFISILLQAYKEGYCRDLIFVPASIAYDRVLEEKSYLKEIAGGSKEKENFRQILRARGFLKRSYGKIYIRFAAPFSLRDYLAERAGCSIQEIRQSLAVDLVQAINSVTPVTPLSLLAAAMLANHRRGFFTSELIETMKTLTAFLAAKGFPVAASLLDMERAIRETLSLLINWRILDLIEDAAAGEEPFYYVDDEKKVQLEYYKNSIIHYMIDHAFVAISLLAGREDEKSVDALVDDYGFLKDLFRGEFLIDQVKDSRTKVGEATSYFVDQGFTSRAASGNSWRITKLGYEKLPIWAALAKTFVESYWIAVRSVRSKGADLRKTEERVKGAMVLGRRLYKSGAVDHIGALSPLNFQNAVAFIYKELQNKSSRFGESGAERLTKLSQKLYEMAHYSRG